MQNDKLQLMMDEIFKDEGILINCWFLIFSFQLKLSNNQPQFFVHNYQFFYFCFKAASLIEEKNKGA